MLVPAAADASSGVGKGPCQTASDCRSGVCVEVNGDAFCSKQCGKCPAGMYCDAQLFSAVGMKVCLKGRATQPVQPKAPPRLPCRRDDDCSGALVCAEMMGHRDCTLPCREDATCAAPDMMGMTVDFFACQLDEGDRSRKACLPKRACVTDPSSCVRFGKGGDGGGGGFAGMAKGAEAWAESMDPNAQEEPTPPEVPEEPAAPVEPATPEAAVAPVAAPKAMAAPRFSRLLGQFERAEFEDERMGLLRTAATRNHFSCAQLGQVVAALEFGDERVEATRILAPRLVDPENSFTVLEHYEFDDEKEAAAAILDRR